MTTYPYEVVSDAVYFIRNHATIYGIPQPAARSGRAETPPIYLPASQNYKIVHAKYVEACQAKDPHFRFLQYKSFISVWKRCLPDIVFMTPRFDVCAKCELFRFQLRDAVHENDKVKVSKEFSEHVELAQQEREYYISLSKKSESEYSQNSETPPEFAHYTFNFAEQVFIPHHARQVGPLYFNSFTGEGAIMRRARATFCGRRRNIATTYGCVPYPEVTVRYGREKCQDTTLRPRVPPLSPLSNVPDRREL